MKPVIPWEHVVARGPSLATKGFQIGAFSQFGLPLHLLLLSLLIVMLGYLRAQEIPQKKGKWWPWCSMTLIWDKQVLCCRWRLWEEREKAICTSVRNCHCQSGDVNPKSWINHTLLAAFPWSLKHTWVWFGFLTFLRAAPQDHCGAEPGTGRNESCMQCMYFHTY